MKILKYILLILLLFCISVFVFIATQPSEYSIKKSKEIALSKDVITKYITNFENWHLWVTDVNKNYFNKQHIKNAAFYSINQENKTTIYEKKNQFFSDSIFLKITQDDLNYNELWKFTSIKKGTLVSLEITGTLTFYQKIFSTLKGGVQSYIGQGIFEDLGYIKDYVDAEINNYSIKINGIVTKKETLFIQKKDSCSLINYNLISKNKILDLYSFAKKNKINYTNKPYASFDYWDEINNKTKFSICLPVNEEIITSEENDIEGRKMFEFKAVKVTFIGDYSHLRKAWKEAFNYIEKNKLTQDLNGNYIESYEVFAPTEKNPSKWITEIYVPIISDTPKRRSTHINSYKNKTATDSSTVSTPEK
tara:strand:+ start:464 stop:1552 length:1089 start_codon:yes stop_codon:yes gene_type:complete